MFNFYSALLILAITWTKINKSSMWYLSPLPYLSLDIKVGR